MRILGIILANPEDVVTGREVESLIKASVKCDLNSCSTERLVAFLVIGGQWFELE